VKRVVFNEVTKTAVLDAFAAARESITSSSKRISHAVPRLPRRLTCRRCCGATPGSRSLARPVRRIAPGLRAGSRDRGVQVARVLDDRGRVPDRGGQTFTARLPISMASASSASISIPRPSGALPPIPSAPPASPSAEIDSRQVRRNPTRHSHLDLQQEASRKLGWPPAARCKSPSASMKA